MKIKKYFLILFFSLFGTYLFSIDFSVDLTPHLGINYGSLKEELIADINHKNETVSLLDWPMNNILFTGLSADFIINNNISFILCGDYKIPFNYSCGLMKDYDWMNFYSTGTDELNRYSQHENKLKNAYSFGAELGYLFNIKERIQIKPSCSINYDYTKLTSYNGYRQYADKIGVQNNNDIYAKWTCDIPKKDLSGKKIISYEMSNLFAGFGLQLNATITQKLNLEFNEDILAALSSQSKDTHHQRKITDYENYFLFDFANKLAFITQLSIKYKVDDKGSFVFGSSFFYSSAKGLMYAKPVLKIDYDWILQDNKIKETLKLFKIYAGYSYVFKK